MQPGGERSAPPEVDVAPTEGDRLDRADRQGGQGAERDQRVHAGGAVAEQPGRVPQERPPTGELDDDGQDQHGPSGAAVSGAARATTRAASARGHEMAARRPQWSGSVGRALVGRSLAPARRV